MISREEPRLKMGLILILFLLCFKTDQEAGGVGRASRPFSQRDQRDLWVVNATVTETITKSGEGGWTFSTKITPDRLIKADHVTIVKKNSIRSNRRASAFIYMVVPNEGDADVLVFYEAKPVTVLVGGAIEESSSERKHEIINGELAQFSSERDDSFHTVLSNASIQGEYSATGRGFSVDAFGQGEQQYEIRRYDQGGWKVVSQSRGPRGGSVGGGASQEPGQGTVVRQGKTIVVSQISSETKTRETQDFGKVTTVTRKALFMTIKPWSDEPPKADPGGPYEVERGGTIVLDGSKSKGNIRSYQWTFAPVAGGPSNFRISPSPKNGQQCETTFLDSAVATLTVSDGRSSSSASVTVKVKPQKWETSFEHVPREGSLQDPVPPRIDIHLMAYSGGANVCSLDSDQNENHTLHPGEQSGTWDERGYTLKKVEDPGGQFDGAWLAEEYKLRISRQTVINPYLLPGGKPPLTGIDPWYDANKKRGAPVDAYLAAIRNHEMEHSRRKKTSLSANDPARRMESIFGQDRDQLKSELDRIIHDAEYALCLASQDPLPRTWQGTLWFPEIDTWIYKEGIVEIGGPTQIATPPCKR